MRPLNPRAPPPLSTALLQIAHRAALVNLISTPEQAKSAVYCETSEPLTSVSIRRRSAAVRGERVVTEGIREMNSGISLNLLMSNDHVLSTNVFPTQISLGLETV